MTSEDAIKWLENLRQDISQPRHEDLLHYEQSIDEIIELIKNLKNLGKKYTSLLRERISELLEEKAKLNLEMNQAISTHIIYDINAYLENGE